MPARLTFADEIANVVYTAERNPIRACIQCGTCTAACPAALFMEHSPRQLIAMIRLNLKEQVLASNTYWTCASCYACTVRCPMNIDIAYMMYGLKRYAMWHNGARRPTLGADFSRRFVRMIMKYGRSFEPGLAAPYLLRHGLGSMLLETLTALGLFRKGRLPLLPGRVRRAGNFRVMLNRIVPMGRAA
jgi:heterodisulfide reductase subunit C